MTSYGVVTAITGTLILGAGPLASILEGEGPAPWPGAALACLHPTRTQDRVVATSSQGVGAPMARAAHVVTAIIIGDVVAIPLPVGVATAATIIRIRTAPG